MTSAELVRRVSVCRTAALTTMTTFWSRATARSGSSRMSPIRPVSSAARWVPAGSARRVARWYPGRNSSGSTTSRAPSPAARAARRAATPVLPAMSPRLGSAWTAATRSGARGVGGTLPSCHPRRVPAIRRPPGLVASRTYGLQRPVVPVTIRNVPRVSQDQLDARRREILDGARACFARYGYEGATVRRLEEQTGLSRGAIFHHFRDKDSLFLAVAEDDTETLVQVMRDLLAKADSAEVPGWLGTQLEVSRRLRTDPDFARRWAARSAAIADATRRRLDRQHEAGVLREDVGVDTLAQFLELAYDGLVLRLATGQPADGLGPVLDLVEEAVRRSG